jgi:hypothetical protein
VPEASVDEDRDPLRWEDDVSPAAEARERLGVLAEAQAALE